MANSGRRWGRIRKKGGLYRARAAARSISEIHSSALRGHGVDAADTALRNQCNSSSLHVDLALGNPNQLENDVPSQD
ncbi:unnamed protein product, partial [Nesidiocoris tenuis]